MREPRVAAVRVDRERDVDAEVDGKVVKGVQATLSTGRDLVQLGKRPFARVPPPAECVAARARRGAGHPMGHGSGGRGD